jgi:cyclopropane-fatty-acyl-phospholipid synthase
MNRIIRGPGSIRGAQRVVEDLFGPPSSRRFAVRYWDGTTDLPLGDAAFTLEIARQSALRRMLVPPSELSIVESYLFGDIDVHGDIEAAATLGDIAVRRIGSVTRAVRLLRHALALPATDDGRTTNADHAARRMFRFGRAHSVGRDTHAVRFHYDVGNDFYALWLDRQMVYSCAWFENGDEDLDTAQVKKLDYVCRKLRLREGERLLDIGCGWGALIIHAAQHYGVRATGITVSEHQAAFARARVDRERLGGRVTVQLRDYRTLRGPEQYDKIASVGMVEHVGVARLPDYFAAAHRVLAPGGLFLNHGIISVADARPSSVLDPVWRRVWKRDQFIRRYVFPDGDLVPVATVIARAEAEGFELRDVESLREHYTMTLRHWVRRLEDRHADAQRIAGEVIYRVWRLYMSAAAYGFRTGRIGVVQSLFAKPDANGLVRMPRTRSDVRAPEWMPAESAFAAGVVSAPTA